MQSPTYRTQATNHVHGITLHTLSQVPPLSLLAIPAYGGNRAATLGITQSMF